MKKSTLYIWLISLVTTILTILPLLAPVDREMISDLTLIWKCDDGLCGRSVFTLLATFFSVTIFLYWSRFLADRFRKITSLKRWMNISLMLLLNFLGIVLLAQLYLESTMAVADLDLQFEVRSFITARSAFRMVVGGILLQILILQERNRITELENARLQEEKTRAELEVLKAQINPHFLFNSLNTLSAIIRTGEKAQGLELVEKMAHVFRYVLQSRDHDMVPLSQELAFLDAYFFMLKSRFGDKLALEIDLDLETRETSIPPMSLQILVENAVKHNMVTRKKPLTVWIRKQGNLLEVGNNLQPKQNLEEGYGIGLANLSKRYQMIVRKEISIEKRENQFIVYLPVISHEVFIQNAQLNESAPH